VNYFEQVVAEVRQELPGITDTQARMYALLVLVMGPGVSAEHVHHAWAVAEPNPHHPCVEQWADLSVEEKRKDKPYARALQRVAAGKRRTSTRRHLPPGDHHRAGRGVQPRPVVERPGRGA